MTTVPVTVAYSPTEALLGEKSTVKTNIYSLGLLTLFVLTEKRPFDPTMAPMRLMDAVKAGVNVNLPRAKQDLVQLIKSMVAVTPDGRQESAKSVFEEICKHDFAFFEGIDPVAIRVELAKFGIEEIPYESRTEKLKRTNVGLVATVDELKQRLRGDQLLVFRAESAEAENTSLRAANARLSARLVQLLTPEELAAFHAEDAEEENRTLTAKITRLKQILQ